jgi:ERCC4-type nuclease
MNLIVDNKERYIIDELVKFNISHSVKQLDIGDFQIMLDGKIFAVWERKTYSDLASSITSKCRYQEQKHRLMSADIPIKGYILEGNYPNHKAKFQGLHEGTVDSIIMGLTVRDGFKLLYSTGLEHTAKILAKMLVKFPEYEAERSGGSNAVGSYQATVVQSGISTVKKENYTPELCYLSQLSQIPQVSYITAKAISERYCSLKSLYSLLDTPTGVTELSKLMVNDRRLGKPAAERIQLYMSGSAATAPTATTTATPAIPTATPAIPTATPAIPTATPAIPAIPAATRIVPKITLKK